MGSGGMSRKRAPPDPGSRFGACPTFQRGHYSFTPIIAERRGARQGLSRSPSGVRSGSERRIQGNLSRTIAKLLGYLPTDSSVTRCHTLVCTHRTTAWYKTSVRRCTQRSGEGACPLPDGSTAGCGAEGGVCRCHVRWPQGHLATWKESMVNKAFHQVARWPRKAATPFRGGETLQLERHVSLPETLPSSLELAQAQSSNQFDE